MDEMIDIPISVTRQHIDDGKRNDCGACPIALAIKESCPGASYVGVWTTGGLFYPSGVDGPCFFDLPLEAKVFVLDFDQSRDVEPIAFPISLPRSIAELPGFLADETLLSPVEGEACGL